MTPRTWLSLTALAVLLSLSAAAFIQAERWVDGKVRQIEEDEAMYREGNGYGRVAFGPEMIGTEAYTEPPRRWIEARPCTPENKGSSAGLDWEWNRYAVCDGQDWVVVERP